MSFMVPYHRNSIFSPMASSLLDDNFFRPLFDMSSMFGQAGFRVDIKEKDDHFELEAELPGVPQDQIELSVEDNVLTITANMNAERKDEKENYVYSERRVGKFQRSFNLDGIRKDDISAKYENGILHLTLPKEQSKEEPKTKRTIRIDA